MERVILSKPKQIIDYFNANKSITYIKIKLVTKLETPWLLFSNFEIENNLLRYKNKVFPLDILEYVVIEYKLNTITGEKKKNTLFKVSDSYLKSLLRDDIQLLL